MPNLIPQEEFNKITDVNVKLNIVFSYIADIYKGDQLGFDKQIEVCQKHWNNCHVRFNKIERRKKIDSTFSGIMGFVGGAIAWLFKMAIGK